MNKAELVDSLADRVGDRKTAVDAVEGIVDVIVRTVNKGDKVTISGFGVFEKRARAARTARNPRTGATVRVKKTNVPAFRPGTEFREVVSGARKLPRVTAAAKAAAPTRTGARAAAGTGSAAAKAKPAARSAATTAKTAARRAAKPAAKPAAKAADRVAKAASSTAAKARTAAKSARKTARS